VATAAGAVPGYLIRRLPARSRRALPVWAALVPAAAAILEFWKDLVRDRYGPGPVIHGMVYQRELYPAGESLPLRHGRPRTARGPASRRRPARSYWRSAPSGSRSWVTEAVGVKGRRSIRLWSFPSATSSIRGDCHRSLCPGILPRSAIPLPSGIGLVFIMNALLIGLPRHNTAAVVFRSQIAYSLPWLAACYSGCPSRASARPVSSRLERGLLACAAVSLLMRTW